MSVFAHSLANMLWINSTIIGRNSGVIAGLEKKNRVLNQAEKERVAHHELGHALMCRRLKIPVFEVALHGFGGHVRHAHSRPKNRDLLLHWKRTGGKRALVILRLNFR